MPICRLCCDEKKPEELVLSLSENPGEIELFEFVDLFCSVKLNRDPCLPQRVCQSCKQILEGFTDFISKVQNMQNVHFGSDNSENASEPEVAKKDNTGATATESDKILQMEATTSRRRISSSSSSSSSSPTRNNPINSSDEIISICSSEEQFSPLSYKTPRSLKRKSDSVIVKSKDCDPQKVPVRFSVTVIDFFYH